MHHHHHHHISPVLISTCSSLLITDCTVLMMRSPMHSCSEWEISEIIRTRTNQEQNITLETPYYDIVRIKVGGGGVG
jgi:hypothetical protein